MKINKLIIISLFTSNLILAQSFEFAKKIGGTDSESNSTLCVDANGNIYSTGSFKGTADFNPGALWNGATSLGSEDVFFQKLDLNGNLLWAKQIGGTGTDKPTAMTIDATGNIYIVGSFQNQVDFDPSTSTMASLQGSSGSIFICKYDSNGNYIWAKKISSLDPNVPNPTGSNSILANSISLDNSGNIYYSGSFGGNIDFNPETGSSNYVELASFGSSDVFISKLDNSGNFIWVKQIGSSSIDRSFSLTTDNLGNVYCTGEFRGVCDFDPSNSVFNITPVGTVNAFLFKLNSNGGFIWAKNFGGTNECKGASVCTDGNNNVIITGFFYGTVDFDPGTSTSNFNSNAGSFDIFITKLSSVGAYIWNKQIGGIENDFSNKIEVDNSNNIYVIGSFLGTVDFDPNSGTANKTSFGGTDAYIVKLNNSGNYLWSANFGGGNSDGGSSIAIDGQSNIYSSGTFSSTADFDPSSSVFNLTSSGLTDIYITKIRQCSTTYGTDVVTACDSYTWINGQTFSASNNSATHILPNSTGCDSIVTLNLTIKPKPLPTASFNGGVLNTGAFSTYQWYLNGSPIQGANSITYSPTQNGNYSVIVTGTNGCSGTSNIVSINTLRVSSILNSPINLYPNPAENFVTISNIPNGGILKINDANGKTVFENQINSNELIVNVSNLSNGIYSVIIEFEGKTYAEKLMITK
jgi:hypothetical protein